MGRTLPTKAVHFSISQVHALTGIPKSTIRFWEREFSGHLSPLRSAGNQRRYDEGALMTIRRIDHLVNREGYTLEGARRRLEEEGREEGSHGRNELKLDELAQSMSDALLKRLFNQMKTLETVNTEV